MRARFILMTAAAAAVLASSCGEDDSEPRRPPGRPLAAPQQEGAQLAFFRVITGNPPRYDIGVSDARGRGVRVLTGDSTGAGVRPAGRPAWSPDARRIAFNGGFGDRGLAADIYVMNADGSAVRRLTSTHDARHPLWSPDGRRIFFARGREASGCGVRTSLWSVSSDGSDLRRLTADKEDTSEVPGSFSPDGRWLAFTRAEIRLSANGECLPTKGQLLVLDMARSKERQLTDDGAEPAFSPDGERIAFVSARDKNGSLNYGDRTHPAHELYTMRFDGSDPRRLTRTHALNEGSPSWLPDGTRLAYHRGEQTGNAEATSILQINPDGTCPTPVLADHRRLGDWFAAPAWRPGSLRSGGGPLRCATGKERRGGAPRREPQAGSRPRSDAEKIRHVHRQYFKEVASGDGEAACRLLTGEYRNQLLKNKRRTDPGIDCPTAVLSGSQVFKGYEPRLERIRVRGAFARAFDPGGRFPPQTVSFKRIGEDWKVLRVRTHYRR